MAYSITSKAKIRKGKIFLGGILINTEQRDYHGGWVYFNHTSKESKDNDFSNWDNLEL